MVKMINKDYEKNLDIKFVNSFSYETLFMDIFRSIRWANGVYCPRCKSFNVNKKGFIDKGYPQGKIRKFKCNDCNHAFNDFSGTFFENSKMPISVLSYIIFNMYVMSVADIAEQTGYSRNTIYNVIKKINKYIHRSDFERLVKDDDGFFRLNGNKFQVNGGNSNDH